MKKTLLLVILAILPLYRAASQSIPHLERKGNTTEFIVNDKPFFILAGELDGSDASSAEFMEKYRWDAVKANNLNAVLVALGWEQIEPKEGTFDFSAVDALIEGARKRELKIVLIWFASWKNGVTAHTPLWVKQDQKRFPVVQTSDGRSFSILSTVEKNNWTADSKAFAALMRHIREVDSKEQTIIMIQVENEIGVRDSSRDFSTKASSMYGSAVPKQLMTYLTANKDSLLPETLEAWEKSGFRTSGTWEQVFGKGERTDEIFMAWNYASYVEKVASAGKAEYPIPMYCNAWIVQPEDVHPGDYPSGGPQAQNHDIWRAAAPSIDILSPDIYLADFPSILAMYMRGGNPGFVPESRSGVNGAANVAYGIGELGLVGYSPMDPTGIVSGPDIKYMSGIYSVISEATATIYEHRENGTIHAVWLGSGESRFIDSKGYRFTFSNNPMPMMGPAPEAQASPAMPGLPDPKDGGQGYAILMEDEGEWTVIASGCTMIVTDAEGKKTVGLGHTIEGRFESDKWVPGRWLNGDQTNAISNVSEAQKQGSTGQGLRFMGDAPMVVKVEAYKFRQ